MIKVVEAGHSFLARLGKTRLRPGGIKATSWLLNQANMTKELKILEVACNQCTNAIELAKQTGCSITAVDLDPNVVELARKRVKDAGLSHLISVEQANALKLPYLAASYDIVINEAMLTMLGDKQKAQALAEYYRVLKSGGVLLTHDVMVIDDQSDDLINRLREVIHVPAKPYDKRGWLSLFEQTGYREIESLTGPMSLLDPIGLIRDEGLRRSCKILFNASKKENRQYFKSMFSFFNNHKDQLGYIAIASRK